MPNTPTTTAPASLILAALVPIQGNAIYAALSIPEKTSFLDASLTPVGDFKAVLVAGNWWEDFLTWLRELIDAAEDIWYDIIDRITDEIVEIRNLPWYWMPPLPPLPIPPAPGGGA